MLEVRPCMRGFDFVLGWGRSLLRKSSDLHKANNREPPTTMAIFFFILAQKLGFDRVLYA